MGILPNNSLGVGAAGTPPAGDLAHAVLSGVFTAVGPSAPFAFQGWANIAIWDSVVTTLTTTAGSLAASVASGTGIAAGGAINSVNLPAGTTWATFSGTSGTLALAPQSYRGVIDEAGNITGMAATTGLLGATVTRPADGGPVLPAGTTVVAITSPTSVLLSAAPTTFQTLNNQFPYVFAPTGNAVTGGADAAASFTDSTLTWSGTVQIERSFDGGATWNCCNVGSSGALAQYTSGPINTSWTEPERGVLYRFNCTAYSSGTINYRMSQTAGGAMSLTLGGVAY